MNAKEKKKFDNYNSFAKVSRIKSYLSCFIPETMPNVRKEYNLPENQGYMGDLRTTEQENEILKEALLYVLKRQETITEKNNNANSVIKSLEKTKKVLTRQLEKLTDRPVATSANSSVPPHMDPLSKKEGNVRRTSSLRQKSDRPVGGQKGHKGCTAKIESAADEKELKYPDSFVCPNCGTTLPKEAFTPAGRRQIVDICDDIKQITDQIIMSAKCPNCGTILKGEYDNNVKGNVNYGKNLTALMVTLNNRHCIPYARSVELIEDFSKIHMSQGTVKNMISRLASNAQEDKNKIIQNLTDPKNGCMYVFADETGAGKNRWLWVFGNDKYVLLVMTHSRSHNEILKIFPKGFVDKYLLTDRHSAYFTADIQVMGHQICLAHIRRNIYYYVEFFPKYDWPKKLYDTIGMLMHDAKINDNHKELYEQYKVKIVELLEEKTERKDLPTDKAVEYIDKFKEGLLKHKDNMLTFLLADIPYHNNDAERAVRETKIKMKVSGCYRSEEGGIYYADLQSIVQTCRKKGDSIYEAFKKLFDKTSVLEMS